MSWFDTAKIANMATKAMKEAQKTLDTALDIQEEGEEGASQESSWSNWKLPKSESDSKLSSSLWGSFSGSYMESGSVGSEPEESLVEDADVVDGDLRVSHVLHGHVGRLDRPLGQQRAHHCSPAPGPVR